MRLALRSLLQHPWPSALAIISLAAGLGLVAALASLADAILFHPLPVSKPREIMRVYTVSEGQSLGLVSYPDFDDFRRSAQSVSGLVAQSQILVGFGDPGAAAQVRMGLAVTADYFDLLGVRSELGRTFLNTEARQPVVVLAFSFWESHYGGRRNLLGETVLLGGSAFTVVGVAARDFGLDRFAHEDFYVPMGVYAAGLLPATGRPLEERGRRYLSLYGRLTAGFSPVQAAAEFSALAARLAAEHPDTNRGRGALLLTEFQSRTHFDRTMPALAAILAGAAALILAIVCSNLFGLLSMRADSRVRQMAIRLALGASHAALFRESLIESLLVTAAGAALGVPLAWTALHLLKSVATFPADARFGIVPHLDLRVDVILLFAATLVTVICGSAPALAARRIDLSGMLKSRTGGTPGRSGAVLVVAEIALASALVGSGGILGNAITAAAKVDLGYHTSHVLVMALDPAQLRYPEGKARAYYEILVERIREMPGVDGVELAQSVPLGYSSAQRQIEFEGAAERTTVWMNVVSGGYFDLMRMPLVAGRTFDGRDTAAGPAVVIVNEELARRCGGQCGMNGHIRMNGRVLQVIGVARNARYMQIGELPRPYFYLPWTQNYASRMFLHIHVAPSEGADAAVLIAAVHSVEREQPVSEIRWLGDYLTRGAMFNARIALEVVGAVGLCGLGLALAGLYGVMGHTVHRRRREIGLRMALGARRSEVVLMIVWHGGRLVIAGTASGIAAALGMARTLASLVAGTIRVSPWTLGAAAAFVILVGLTACLIPAWRASAIDPASTLRDE